MNKKNQFDDMRIIKEKAKSYNYCSSGWQSNSFD